MDQKPTKDYANQIKRLRARMGLSQADLAERLGVSFPTVYHCGTSTPQLVRVQYPYGSLLVRPFGRTQTVEHAIRGTVESRGVRIGHARIMEVGEI
jgi:transcriptional regulator with XRE-family HTH domain